MKRENPHGILKHFFLASFLEENWSHLFLGKERTSSISNWEKQKSALFTTLETAFNI